MTDKYDRLEKVGEGACSATLVIWELTLGMIVHRHVWRRCECCSFFVVQQFLFFFSHAR